MDTLEAELILYNHLTFTEVANYLSDLSKEGHISFHSSQESSLNEVQGKQDDDIYFLGTPKEQAKVLTPLLRMLTLHAGHVDGSYSQNMVHPVIESRNVPSFEYVKNYGCPFELSQEPSHLQKFLSLFHRLFLPHNVEKQLIDCEKGNVFEVNGGMLFTDDGEFLLIRCKMEEMELDWEEEVEGKAVKEIKSVWSLVASISTGELHGRLDDVMQKLRDIFTDSDNDV